MSAAPPRVAFLVPDLGRSGGIAVIAGWARRLGARGFDAELLVCGPKPGPQPPERDGVPVRLLRDSRGERFDVAVASWWTTVEALQELWAERRVALLQNIEHRFYRDGELADRGGAAAVLAKPLDFVCVAGFALDLMAELRPDARCLVVRPGVDKAAFRPRPQPTREGPLRVLVEGQPTLWFKQVPEAVAAVRGMAEPATVTVVAQDPGTAGELGADRVVGGLDAHAMAALYAEHDVQLKLPRFEGLGLPPIEGFHVGLPCVTTPFTGHEEFMEHGVNGLVVGFDDPGAVRGALDLLATGPELLARLSEGALATAARWPDEEQSADELAAALEAFLAVAQPPADLAHLERVQRLSTELQRDRLSRLEGLVAWRDEELADTRATLAAAVAERDRLAVELGTARLALDEVVASRAYRVGTALRRLAHWRWFR